MVDSTELISFSLYFSFFTELLFVDLSASLKDVHHCISKGLHHSSASIDFNCPSFFSCKHTWSIWCRIKAKFHPRYRSLSPFLGELPQIKHWVRTRKGRSTQEEIVIKPKHVGVLFLEAYDG